MFHQQGCLLKKHLEGDDDTPRFAMRNKPTGIGWNNTDLQLSNKLLILALASCDPGLKFRPAACYQIAPSARPNPSQLGETSPCPCCAGTPNPRCDRRNQRQAKSGTRRSAMALTRTQRDARGSPSGCHLGCGHWPIRCNPVRSAIAGGRVDPSWCAIMPRMAA